MNGIRIAFAAAALASTLALGQGQEGPHGHPPRIDIAALLQVDTAKAQQVQAILDDGRTQVRALHEQMGRPTDDASRAKMREAMESIHQSTDTKLAAILTPDQLAKLKAAMPSRPPGAPRGEHMNPQ